VIAREKTKGAHANSWKEEETTEIIKMGETRYKRLVLASRSEKNAMPTNFGKRRRAEPRSYGEKERD